MEAKSILNLLREDHTEEWENSKATIALKGLRAKFAQNKESLEYLHDTQERWLGEASKNPCWGVGMTLEDKDILDMT